MDLTARLLRFAAARPHVLVVAAVGHTAERLAVEAELARRGWPAAMSPADTDVLVVAGIPGPELAPVIEALWQQVPAPRARAEIPETTVVAATLDHAVALLADPDRQRRDPAPHRPSPTIDVRPRENGGHRPGRAARPSSQDGEHDHAEHDQGKHEHSEPEHSEHEHGRHDHGEHRHDEHSGRQVEGRDEHSGHQRDGRDEHSETEHGGHDQSTHRNGEHHHPEHGHAEHDQDEHHHEQVEHQHTGHGDHDTHQYSEHQHTGHVHPGQQQHEGRGDHSGHDHDIHDPQHSGHQHSAHDHGGGMGMPSGLPMADVGPDRDGLTLDRLRVPLGPVLPDWPAGLVVEVVLQGDVVQKATARILDRAAGQAAESFWDAPDADRARRTAARHLDGLARLLGTAGWADPAATARHLRDELLSGAPVGPLRVRTQALVATVRRSRTLRRMLRGLGRGAADVDTRLAARLSALEAAAADLDQPASSAGDGGGGPMIRGWGAGDPGIDELAELLVGAELAAARLIVAAVDPDTDRLPTDHTGRVQRG